MIPNSCTIHQTFFLTHTEGKKHRDWERSIAFVILFKERPIGFSLSSVSGMTFGELVCWVYISGLLYARQVTCAL